MNYLKKVIIYFILFCLPFATFSEEAPEKSKGTFKPGFFIDTYYAYVFNKPKSQDIKYLTQPARNNEANINLAYLEAKYDSEKVRGRLALQYGTSVNVNYSAERQDQSNSNQLSVRNLQEAYVGIKVFKKLWIDGGIYFGNIGLESWISKENWVYTRALALEYVPYYSTGVRATYEVSRKLEIQFHLMNSWSTITETNKDKAVGTQMVYKPTNRFKIIYNTFVGNETPETQPRQTRYYNNFIAQYDLNEKFSLAGSFDVGIQKKPNLIRNINEINSVKVPDSHTYKQWYIATIWIRYQINSVFYGALRFERMLDREQAIITTNSPNGFQTTGGSINFDYKPVSNALARLEFRTFRSLDAVFPTKEQLSNNENFVVTSMSLWY